MGHTLIAIFSGEPEQMLSAAGVHHNNKIPFGKGCDREQANRILPYHVTLFHWAREQDAQYLPRMDRIRFAPCTFRAEAPCKSGTLLYLPIVPEKGFDAVKRSITDAVGTFDQSFLHLTISIGTDSDELKRQQQAILNTCKFPMRLPVAALELYHIWSPVSLVKRIG